MLRIPSIYEQAMRLMISIVGTVTLVPTLVILRRLLERNWHPILNAILIMYFWSSSECSRRLCRCWPGSYFSAKCLASPSFLSGCFGVGIYSQELLKPTVAVGE
jgi:hypothetical protein